MRRKARAELKLAERLHCFKMRRFSAAVDSGKGSATKQLERYHMANQELLMAKIKHSVSRENLAEIERDAYKAVVTSWARQ